MHKIITITAAAMVAFAGSAQAKCPKKVRVVADTFGLYTYSQPTDEWTLEYPYQPQRIERVGWNKDDLNNQKQKRLLIGFPFPRNVDGVECKVTDFKWALSTRNVERPGPGEFYKAYFLTLWNEGREPSGMYEADYAATYAVFAWFFDPELLPRKRYTQRYADGFTSPYIQRTLDAADRANWDASMEPESDQHLWFAFTGYGDAEVITSSPNAMVLHFFFEERTEPLE